MNNSLLPLAAAVALGISGMAQAQEDSPPTVPTNLAAARYDGAGAELFWNRSTDDRGVQGYEVTVNGQSVGVLDATSYYDASLQAGTAYTFTVTAVDSAGQRSSTATTTLSVDNGSSPATGTAPPAPANLTASVYSLTAAELFWTRAQVPNLRYEVSINGAVVATVDGTSYFTDALVANQSFNIDVVAIDASGARSTPSTVSFATGTGAGAGVEAPTPGTTDTFAEITPNNLTIQVYSSTAAELFWTPSEEFSRSIQSNEIRRNGELIATLQGGSLRSYFDDTRVPGTDYTYVVTAIAEQGSASAQISDTGATPPAVTPTPTNPASDIPANVQASLATAFDLINGDAVARVALIIDQLSVAGATDALGLTATGETAMNSNQQESDVLDCPNGGQLLDNGIREGSNFGELEAVDCGVGSVVFSFFTQFRASEQNEDGFNLETINAIDIELDDQRDLSTTIIEQFFAFSNGPGARFSGFNIDVDSADRSYIAGSIRGADQDEQNTLPDGSLGLTATAQRIAGIFDDEAALRTLNPLEFTDDSQDGQPTQGRIIVESATDSLLIDASNGDPSSFTLTVTEDGATTSYTVPFSDGFRFNVPFIDGVDSGL